MKNNPKDLKAILTTDSEHLEKSERTSIIMIDEIDIDHAGIATKTSDGNRMYEVDFRYLAKYTNVHFIMSLRPQVLENKQNNFLVKFVKDKNQHDQIFFQRHRCAKEIKNRKDLFGRKVVLDKIEIDKTYPRHILNNKSKYKEWIL